MWFPNNLKFIRTLVDEQRNQPKLQKHLSSFTQVLQEWEEQIEARAAQKSSREEDLKRILKLLPQLEKQLKDLYAATAGLGTTSPVQGRNLAKLCTSFAESGDDCKPFQGLLEFISDIFDPTANIASSSLYKQVTAPFSTNLSDRWENQISNFWYPEALDFSFELFKQVRSMPSLDQQQHALAKLGIPYLAEQSMFSYKEIKPITKPEKSSDYQQRFLELQELLESDNYEQWLPLTGVQVDICKEAKSLLNLLDPILTEVNSLNSSLEENLEAVVEKFNHKDLAENFPIFYELVRSNIEPDSAQIKPQDLVYHLLAFNLGFYCGEVINTEKAEAHTALQKSVISFREVFKNAAQQKVAELSKQLKPILAHGMRTGLAVSQVKTNIAPKYRAVQQLLGQLRRYLTPWRKGPFNLFGQEFDSEWVADVKLRRLTQVYTLEAELDSSNTTLIQEEQQAHDLRLAELSWIRQLQFNANELKKAASTESQSVAVKETSSSDQVRNLPFPKPKQLPAYKFRPLDYIGNCVLDVGTGNGAFLWKFAEYKHRYGVPQIFIGIDSFEKFALQHAVVDLCMKYTDLNVLPLRLPYNMEAVPVDHYTFSDLVTTNEISVRDYNSAIKQESPAAEVWRGLNHYYAGITWAKKSADIRTYFSPYFAQFTECRTEEQREKGILPWHNVHLLPVPLDKFPETAAFDTVICMGVLYHRKDPVIFLEQLRKQLDKGHLILETLYNPDPEGRDFYPQDGKYAGMSNVYCLPTLATLSQWLNQAGFKSWKVAVGSEPTSNAEQRSTEYSSPSSIAEFLAEKPEEIPPTRIIIVAEKK